jgi:hypothetical protein
MTNDAPFEYIETKDPVLVARYVDLRRRVFRAEYPWLDEDFGDLDETDGVSRIVVARRVDFVGGGGRLTVSTPEGPRALPLEDGFSLRKSGVLNKLGADREPYGEISRVAVDRRCTKGLTVSFGLGNKLCDLASAEGLDVVFSICPDAPARLNEINAKNRGVKFERHGKLATAYGRDMWLCSFSGLRRAFGPMKEAA